ncbi:FAD linked oxidase domain-containing protein [Natrialba magadii ATCC 43099]|uniref:FAD linked oxidase domain-containing protein n=1 Tax=Natrialba magadii (strain ATCC 43099 / DSM 3394 / CCM 3739 / CIP 104546 / IAM 13178 / JCM 8861 / NBRC 102185 / NCIMB 2190 / MS3) TaxID=547559 RepID=L9UQX4_NATMM|nr:FAD linked oxidase domain-containing protein [Natrialba magadii ATCC 43099]
MAVRSGGHNVSGSAVCDDGMVIDLAEMNGVWVDPDERTVWAQAGATLGDVDHETQVFGLATPLGVVSDTGVAGLTLGGGIGHLRNKYGLSCDNLTSVGIVTADGEYCTASENENEELFWGLRGGGGTFGIVTGFEFDLHPVGPEVATGLVFYPGDLAVTVLPAFRDYEESAPDELTTLVSMGVFPEEELFPVDAVDKFKIAILGVYADAPGQGETVIEPLRKLGEPLADFSGRIPYTEFQQLFDDDYPDGMRYYWKSLYLASLSDDVIHRSLEWAEAAPSRLSTVDIWPLGGAIADVGHDESAFAGREAPYLLGVEANWEDPRQDGANVEWARDCLDDMRQFSDGSVYLNFPGFYEDSDEMLETTFGDAYDRLVALKNEYDPTNLFSPTQNIEPTTW